MTNDLEASFLLFSSAVLAPMKYLVDFTEIGPGKVLQGLIQKIDKTTQVDGVN